MRTWEVNFSQWQVRRKKCNFRRIFNLEEHIDFTGERKVSLVFTSGWSDDVRRDAGSWGMRPKHAASVRKLSAKQAERRGGVARRSDAKLCEALEGGDANVPPTPTTDVGSNQWLPPSKKKILLTTLSPYFGSVISGQTQGSRNLIPDATTAGW